MREVLVNMAGFPENVKPRGKNRNSFDLRQFLRLANCLLGKSSMPKGLLLKGFFNLLDFFNLKTIKEEKGKKDGQLKAVKGVE
jgi:hypothetical protein